jgi:hypothetical protein
MAKRVGNENGALPFIRTPEALLALLRQNPTLREVIVSEFTDLRNRRIKAVCDYPDHIGGERTLLAFIAIDSTADQLVDAVIRADAEADAEAWARLPLRYHPFNASCVLPEHPQAPLSPGTDIPSADELAEIAARRNEIERRGELHDVIDLDAEREKRTAEPTDAEPDAALAKPRPVDPDDLD